MTTFRVLAHALLVTVTVRAQGPPAPLGPDQQPDTQTLAMTARSLARNTKAPDDIKSQAERLISESGALQNAGKTGETRRKLAHAITLLNGQLWDQKTEWAWSLALRVDNQVADSSLPLIARISQYYEVPYKPAHALQCRAMLIADSAGDAGARMIRQIGAFEIAAANFAEPFGFDANLEGVTDGAYRLKTELLDGDQVAATLQKPIQVVRGIASELENIERRLARIQGHDSTKATIRYPYVLATTANVGRRHLNAADFGIPFDPRPVPYDFTQGVRHSAELLTALEHGKDRLWLAKGDHQRHYWFEEAREMMPYRLYVPEKWDGRSKLPMVLVLHGSTRDENFYFDRDGGILAKQAEQHGFAVVCPLGYRPSADWGSAPMATGNPAIAGQAGRGGAGFANPARVKENEWSERDALNVLDLVRKEYPIDATRIYLFGHSRGGAGAWYLGQKFPERWAAMATSAAGIGSNGFESLPYERLQGLPLMIVVGDKDPALNATRLSVKLAKEHGLNPLYLEAPGATHESIVAIEEPQVFDFFDQHRRK